MAKYQLHEHGSKPVTLNSLLHDCAGTSLIQFIMVVPLFLVVALGMNGLIEFDIKPVRANPRQCIFWIALLVSIIAILGLDWTPLWHRSGC